ncbi:hypothetical protein K9B33_22645 [Sphingobium sp. 3R8]|uniref:hypothetical protein n=1 Tax=Sphingobium sp. 3R8 TaxID=2874921 RepID=UPI001CC9B7B7|nr:hypothetical protein [Sphingobium sp. 3R8]MBZ9650334.1 hypothetical protein [Sphingobium sp. 3R8]
MISQQSGDRSDPVLDRWRHLAGAPQTLTFSNMELLAGDHEPSIVQGRGEILLGSPRSFEYTLYGKPTDIAYTLKQMLRQRENRYDGLKRFRLIATADDGTEFAAGWTIPRVETDNEEWMFTGECEGLMIDDPTVAPSQHGATEVRFIVPRQHRASLFFAHFVTTAKLNGGLQPEYELDLGEATLRFSFDAKTDMLTIRTIGSQMLPLTYTENWLGEPLRILFGQLIFPRLVARSFPKGGAMVRVGPAPAWHLESNWAGLWQEEDVTGKDRFWQLYADLLRHVAKAGQFEGHKITKLYEEVIQASRGSRWVWALTFASSIEGLIRMLAPRGSKRDDAEHEAIGAIAKHIASWKAPHLPKATVDRFRSIATGAVHRASEATPRYVLSKLKAAKVIEQSQIDAWEKIRNEVMHGSLISPYSSEEDDAILLALSSLLHALTREVVRPTVKFS